MFMKPKLSNQPLIRSTHAIPKNVYMAIRCGECDFHGLQNCCKESRHAHQKIDKRLDIPFSTVKKPKRSCIIPQNKHAKSKCLRISKCTATISMERNTNLARAVNRQPCLPRGMTRRAFSRIKKPYSMRRTNRLPRVYSSRSINMRKR